MKSMRCDNCGNEIEEVNQIWIHKGRDEYCRIKVATPPKDNKYKKMKYKTFDDVLVIRTWDSEKKKLSSKGKRVSKDFPLTKEEIRAYVEKGIVALIKLVKDRLGLGLKETVDYVKKLGVGVNKR